MFFNHPSLGGTCGTVDPVVAWATAWCFPSNTFQRPIKHVKEAFESLKHRYRGRRFVDYLRSHPSGPVDADRNAQFHVRSAAT